MLSLAFKNGVIMILIILIIHFLIKNLLDSRGTVEEIEVKEEQVCRPDAPKSDMTQGTKEVTEEVKTMAKHDDEELLQYIKAAVVAEPILASEPAIACSPAKPESYEIKEFNSDAGNNGGSGGMFSDINGFEGSSSSYFEYEKLI